MTEKTPKELHEAIHAAQVREQEVVRTDEPHHTPAKDWIAVVSSVENAEDKTTKG